VALVPSPKPVEKGTDRQKKSVYCSFISQVWDVLSGLVSGPALRPNVGVVERPHEILY
jgi:hypothetical protein